MSRNLTQTERDLILYGFLSTAEWADVQEDDPNRDRLEGTCRLSDFTARTRAAGKKYIGNFFPAKPDNNATQEEKAEYARFWQEVERFLDFYGAERFGNNIAFTSAGHGVGFQDFPYTETLCAYAKHVGYHGDVEVSKYGRLVLRY